MAVRWYNKGLAEMAKGNIDWDSTGTVLKTLLLTSKYVYSSTHDFVSEVVGGASTREPGGGTYARKTLASKTVTQDDTNGRAVLDAADLTWTALTSSTAKTVTQAVIFKSTGADSACPLIGCFALSASHSIPTSAGTDLTVQFSTAGILRLNNSST